ncbi:hypothetical protein DdX_10547 [Ditylenchus destructor]|uniref:Uncharacterized protein n=1 Tax=Ditylenchus destructor TaxID=166010 RepID=A0AAD4QZ76_9BILA|nr:hypothetical protein DdX_10547 [Ditylenchus destructor]
MLFTTTPDFTMIVKLCMLCYISSLVNAAFDQQSRDKVVQCFGESCSTLDTKTSEEDPCTYAKQGQCKVRCIVNSSDIGAFLENYVQLANYMCDHVQVILQEGTPAAAPWTTPQIQDFRTSGSQKSRKTQKYPAKPVPIVLAHREEAIGVSHARIRAATEVLALLRDSHMTCIDRVRNDAADIKDCTGSYHTIMKTIFTPFYLPSEQWCREVHTFRKCTKSAIEETCGNVAALYHEIEIAAKINEKIAQHLLDGSLKSWALTGTGSHCELALKAPHLESTTTTTRAVPRQSTAIPINTEQSTVQTGLNATELMPSTNSTVENDDEDNQEDSTDETANCSTFKSLQYIVFILWTFAVCFIMFRFQIIMI